MTSPRLLVYESPRLILLNTQKSPGPLPGIFSYKIYSVTTETWTVLLAMGPGFCLELVLLQAPGAPASPALSLIAG